MDYPRVIHIETTGRCNSHCVFCPHSRSYRRLMDMPQMLFEKILKDVKDIPQRVIIVPLKLGEPLVDPLFSKRLLQIDEQLPEAYLELHTNLNILPREFIPTLRKLRRVNHIWVSLNYYTAASYRAATGMKFDQTLYNIKKLLEARLPHTIAIGRVLDYTIEDQKWLDWVRRTFPQAKPAFLHRGDWCNNIETPNTINDGFCKRTLEVSICCDGKVALCCMDGLCEYPLGDITKEHILEVYNGSKASALRRMTQRLQEPCASCTFV